MNMNHTHAGDRDLNFKAVLFDMDGVLIDSEPLYNEADTQLFASLGLPFGQREIAAITGVSHRVFGKQMLDWYPNLPYGEEELRRMYVDGLLTALKGGNVQLEPGVENWMKRLADNGVKMAISSSSVADMVYYVVERFGLHRYLSAVVTGSDVLLGKPHPDIFLKSAEALEIEPRDCLVIEDSTNGINAALAAGMTCAAYTATNRHDLDQSKAHQRFAAFDDTAWTALFGS